MHESLDEFKFRPDTDTNTRVICPCASEKLLYNVVTTLAPSFFDRIFYILAGNEDIHNISDEFKNLARSDQGLRTALERLEKSP